MTEHHSTIKGRANRLLVFREIKNFIESEGRSPTSYEVSIGSGLSPDTCKVHMRALVGAKGLSGFSMRERGENTRAAKDWANYRQTLQSSDDPQPLDGMFQ